MARTTTLVATLTTALLAWSPAASAQQAPATSPTTAARALPAASELLRVTRLEYAAREDARGRMLLGWGISSVVAGASIVGASYATLLNARWASIGWNTLGWGAVNVALAVPWLLGVRGEQASAQRDAGLSGVALEQAANRARGRAHRQATVFAVNTGLDVAYVLAGVLLWQLADRDPARPDDVMAGVGLAALVQGAFLFVFDLWSWIEAEQHHGALERARVR